MIKKSNTNHNDGYFFNTETYQEEYQIIFPTDIKLKTMGQQQFEDQWYAPTAPKLNARSNSFFGYAYNYTPHENQIEEDA